MKQGIVLYGGDDEAIAGRAKAARLKFGQRDQAPGELPYDKTLLVAAGTRVPWDLLPAAWHFLDRWDAAVPLWRYGKTAQDVGTPEEREATRAVVHDLRVLLHSVELLFVRRNATGKALVAAWVQELGSDGADRRLAFLRAVCQVKPRLCVLPTSWLAEVHAASRQALHGRLRPANAGAPLVTIELEPGRLVKCHAGDEEKVLAQFRSQRGRRQ